MRDADAHARRVYSEHRIGLSAPISAESVQNKQPLVAHNFCQRKLIRKLKQRASGSRQIGVPIRWLIKVTHKKRA
jgi:hypothetical protein